MQNDLRLSAYQSHLIHFYNLDPPVFQIDSIYKQ